MSIIFITYVNRSGSTYLANSISKSPEIFVCPEAEILIDLFLTNPTEEIFINKLWVKKIKHILTKDKKLKFWGIHYKNLQIEETIISKFEVFYAIINEYRNIIKPNASFILFKGTDLIFHYMEFGKRLKAQYKIKFIALIRDPRSIYYSQLRTISPTTKKRMCSNPIDLGNHWIRFTNSVENFRMFPDFFILKFEDLICDYSNNLKLIFSYFVISFNQNLQENPGDLFSRLPDDHKKIHPNITKPPMINSINNWENHFSKYSIHIIQKITGSYLDNLNYSRFEIRINPYVYLIIYFYYFFRSKISLFKAFLKSKWNFKNHS
ncbi:hypothetical protein ES705_14368 [subsurface metagenome]